MIEVKNIEYITDGNSFVAKTKEFPGGLGFGNSKLEAEKELIKVIEWWLSKNN